MPSSAASHQPSPTVEALLREVAKLGKRDLETFVQKALLVQAEKRTSVLSPEESELLQAINETLTEEEWSRFHELVEKRQEEIITKQELKELIKLTDKTEEISGNRLHAIIKLANLRKISIQEAAKEFGYPRKFDATLYEKYRNLIRFWW